MDRKAEITRYYEHKRPKPMSKRLEVPELTQEEIRDINQRLYDMGMERFIVLEDEGEILF